MGEKSHVRVSRSGKAQELEEEPKSQDHHGRNVNQPGDEKDEKERKDTGVGEQHEVGPQDSADRPTGPDHGNR